MRTIDRVTEDFAGTIFKEFNENRCIAAFGEGDSFGIRKEDIVALSEKIFTYQNVENVECDFAEEVRNNLIDKGGPFIIGRECSAVLWKCN